MEAMEMGGGKVRSHCGAADTGPVNPSGDMTMCQSTDMIIISCPPEKEAEVGPTNNSENGQVTHPTSVMETLLHIFKGNVGSGLLAMGDAYKNGGLIFAPILTVVLGVMNVHAQHLLLDCSTEMHRRVKMEKPPNFAQTVELCFATGPMWLRRFAKIMGFLVNFFLCITQLGFCCVYIVFIGTNVQKIAEQYGLHVELSILMAYTLIPILIECCVRNLKYLAPLSSIANVCMCIGVAIVVYEASQDLPEISSRQYLASWSQLPLFFGTTVYAFEGIGLVLPLKSEMKKPELFQKPFGVLNMGMIVVGSLYIVVGFLGYLKWGDDVQGSLTLNMAHGKIMSQVVQGLIVIGILFSYPLQFYVPVDIMWPAVAKRLPRLKSEVAPQIMFRVLLALLTFVLAESIPQLGLFISLVGAVSSTALALVFPPIIELVVASQSARGLTAFILIKDILIVLFGFFIFFTGTYESVAAIIKAFQI